MPGNAAIQLQNNYTEPHREDTEFDQENQRFFLRASSVALCDAVLREQMRRKNPIQGYADGIFWEWNRNSAHNR